MPLHRYRRLEPVQNPTTYFDSVILIHVDRNSMSLLIFSELEEH